MAKRTGVEEILERPFIELSPICPAFQIGRAALWSEMMPWAHPSHLAPSPPPPLPSYIPAGFSDED